MPHDHPAPRTLVVVGGQIRLQQCALYRGHACAVVEQHHICPKSWWISAGKAIATPMIQICSTCHGSTHAALDGILAGRDVTLLPPRCVALARQGLTIAAANGLTPTPTL